MLRILRRPKPPILVIIKQGIWISRPVADFPQRPQDTKKYLQIYEDLDSGFVGANQVLMLFYRLSSTFTHIL